MNDYEAIISTGVRTRDLAIATATANLVQHIPDAAVWGVNVYGDSPHDSVEDLGVGLNFTTRENVDHLEQYDKLLREWPTLESLESISVTYAGADEIQEEAA